MSDQSSTPEEAAALRARWQLDSEPVRHELLDRLSERGIDIRGLAWLSPDETAAQIQRWIDLGAQRYGRLALIPPAHCNVRRGEFRDGTLPTWLDLGERELLVSFSRPFGSGQKRIARCESEFVRHNLVDLARADGDGFAAMSERLEGVLLVNVEERLGDSSLDIDAWGEFILPDAI